MSWTDSMRSKRYSENFTRNGITDLAGIFKGWYESYKKNLTETFTRW